MVGRIEGCWGSCRLVNGNAMEAGVESKDVAVLPGREAIDSLDCFAGGLAALTKSAKVVGSV